MIVFFVNFLVSSRLSISVLASTPTSLVLSLSKYNFIQYLLRTVFSSFDNFVEECESMLDEMGRKN